MGVALLPPRTIAQFAYGTLLPSNRSETFYVAIRDGYGTSITPQTAAVAHFLRRSWPIYDPVIMGHQGEATGLPPTQNSLIATPCYQWVK